MRGKEKEVEKVGKKEQKKKEEPGAPFFLSSSSLPLLFHPRPPLGPRWSQEKREKACRSLFFLALNSESSVLVFSPLGRKNKTAVAEGR